MKKVLILTVTAGNAHNACAIGMKNKLESLGNVEVKVVNILKEYSTKLNVWVTDRGYCISVSKFLPLFNAFYEHFKKRKPERRYSAPSQNTVVSMLSGLMQEIITFKPDVIYSTHFYGAIALTDLKLLYDIPAKTLVSSLDFVTSPFWECCIGVNYFNIPNEDFIDESIAIGFKREQLLPFGLPVNEKTLEKMDKKEARTKLGLDENLFTILFIFGGGYWSGGFKIFKDLIKALKGRTVQVIMINGKNKKGFDKIEKMKFEENIKVVNVGFTNEVPLYLSASDMILNKCGGASAGEMINKSIPMLITKHLPSQEIYNLKYLTDKGVALSFKNAKELKHNLLYLLDNPEKLEEMREKTKPLCKKAITDLGNFIMKLPNADYTEFLKQEINLSTLQKQIKQELKKADKKSRLEVKSK